MRIHLTAVLLMAAVLINGCATRSASSGTGPATFDFALIGDVPYSEEQVTTLFPNLVTALNHERLAFVVHDGDIKAGASPCSDAVFEERFRQFQTIQHPFIYLFGDNEWTDCGNGTNHFDPEERLMKLREVFTAGDQSLGQRKIRLTRQSEDAAHAKFRENVRWQMGGVMFVGLNVPGSSNNYGKPEFAERNAANIAWLKQAFTVARRDNLRALMVIFQANPLPERGSTNRVHAGFKEMLEVLEQETLAFQKPIVLVHGDSHYFRIDKPLTGTKSKRRIENFTRVETFGSPDAHWLQVTVDAGDPNVFTFRPQIVKANVVNHRGAGASGRD